MPPKRPASEVAAKIELVQPRDDAGGQDEGPVRATEKQPKLEKIDLITEFSKSPRLTPVKREASPVKIETTNDGTFVKGSRTYLSVPIEEKEIAKTHGAHWDATAKRWYVINEWSDGGLLPGKGIGFHCLPDLQPLHQNGWRPQPPPSFTAQELELCTRWASGDPDLDAELLAFPRLIVSEPSTIIPCKYEDKDKVKSLGGLWAQDTREWYIQNVQVNPEVPSDGYFIHPIHKLLFCPWLEPVPLPAPPSPSQPASPNPRQKLNICPVHNMEVQVLAASPSAKNPGKLYEVCPVKSCQAVLPGTKPGLWRWHQQRNVCPVHHVEVKQFQVKAGMEHNNGRWFEKCPIRDCSAQLPGTDVGLWRWSDGSLPFSSQSQDRFERFHGLSGGYGDACGLM